MSSMRQTEMEDVPTTVDETAPDMSNEMDLSSILGYLRKNNFKLTESALLRETTASANQTPNEAPVRDVPLYKNLESFQSSDDPELFSWNYGKFCSFLDSTLDSYKHELSLLLYPVFLHMYLNLVYNGHENKAMEFYDKFHLQQEHFFHEYLEKLRMIRKREHMETNELVSSLRANKYIVKMAREAFTHLKRFLQDNKMIVLLSLIQDQLIIETYDGAPRTRALTVAAVGGLFGEARKDVNKSKVLYGLLKEPEISLPADDDDDTEEGDKPKKKSRKKDTSAFKKAKNDPNAPNPPKIPLPEMRDVERQERVNAYKDSLKRVQLGPGSLPSVCFYTFLNSFSGVSCTAFTDDSSMVAAGFEDSRILVWSLMLQKLMCMKSADSLMDLDKDSDDIMEQMMDDTTASDFKTLVGHSGCVFAVSFSPDRHYLLSSSEDGTVRLWSLLTWSNIVCYKGHNYPVFDVQFSPHGFYFASGGHDKLARLWSTDHYQPLRLFAGHFADVDCVKFHPNSHYVATGSSDRCVRLFEVMSGNCARTLCGHKGTVLALAFSPCGRYLASGSADRNVHIWDLANGTLVSRLSQHKDPVISLSFSREGTVLASGGLDNLICIWDLSALNEERAPPDINVQQLHELVDLTLLTSFPTKATSPVCLMFTRRNLLLGAGAFKM